MSSALNQNSNGIAAAGMTGPVYVTEPPLSPPSPRASAQAPVPTPPQPERPVLEIAPAPAPAPVSEAPPAAEPEAPAELPLEGLLLRFGLITTEQLTEAMRERSATGKDIGAIVVERGWVDAAQLARVVSGDTAPARAAEPTQEPEVEPEPVPAPPPPAATQATGQRVKVFVRLTSGERVDAGSFGSLDQAKERGAEIARALAADSPEWPFVAGRFLRPDTIVSLDVEPELSA